jgi:hypothetical protein
MDRKWSAGKGEGHDLQGKGDGFDGIKS